MYLGIVSCDFIQPLEEMCLFSGNSWSEGVNECPRFVFSACAVNTW